MSAQSLREHLPRSAFGDSPALADELAALVLAGRKTATCGALWQYEAEGEAVPVPGQREILLDGKARERCVIQYTEVRVLPFDQVGEAFARDEGEGDLSYAWWRAAHEGFFRRQGPFSETMPVVCLRFRVIETLADGDLLP